MNAFSHRIRWIPRIPHAVSAAMLATAFLLPLPASAADADRSGADGVLEAGVLVMGTSLATNPDIERAMELEARAWAMRDLVDERRTAARLYREAAALRPDDDPVKVRNLRSAASMNYFAGRLNRAVTDADEAARLARRQGDVMEAAHAYLDAAWLAERVGDAPRKAGYLEEARLLMASPLLAASQREELGYRIDATT